MRDISCWFYIVMSTKIKVKLAFTLLVFTLISTIYISPNNNVSRSSIRSSSLHKITKNTDNSERTIYLDDNGKVTLAADLGYAIKIISKANNGTLEEYFDEFGNPVCKTDGYYAIEKEYDENGLPYHISYLGADGMPVIISYGYAIVLRTFDDEGRIDTEFFYDDSEKPICSKSYGWGKKTYDENGNISQITYLDEFGEPSITNSGYATVKRIYYSTEGNGSGKVEYEFYFDEDGEPISISLGQFGIHRIYDEYGNTTEMEYLDATGCPILTNKGYSKVIRTFHEDNSLATERYYDLVGNPVSLSEGQYGRKIENGQTIYLHADGSEQYNIRNLLYNHSWVVIIFTVFIIVVSSFIDRRYNTVLLLLHIGGIIYLTLMFRDSGGEKLNTQLFWSYRRFFTDTDTRANILKNIWLFVPLGAILYHLYPKKTILLVPVLFSISIEITQYVYGIGLCEFGDVISNGFGGCIGFMAGELFDGTIKRWIRGHIRRRSI